MSIAIPSSTPVRLSPRRSAPLAAARPQPPHLHAVPPTAETPWVETPLPAAPAALPAVVSAGLIVPTTTGPVTYANFDHAASTPALTCVAQAVEGALRTYSSVHRGNGYASRVTSAWYEQARAEVHAFVGARDDDTLVFTRHSTDSLNLLAHALPQGTTVFAFESEHHAALLPWGDRRTVRLPVPGSVRDAEVLLRDALRSHPARHRLVVLTGASNVTGETWPVRRLATIAHEAGARVVVDAAQLAPHRRVDLDELGADYLVLSGHKLYAPYGAGVLVGRADWLDAAAPYLAGGGATAAVTAEGVAWHTGPARHEAGSPNVIGAIALAAACQALTSHRAQVEAHESAIGAALVEGLRAIEGVSTYSLFGEDHDRVAVVTFTVDGLDPALVSAALAAEHGIGVRDGKFCAHLCVDALLDGAALTSTTATRETVISDTAVRASAGLATTAADVERLLAAVRELATDGPRETYQRTAAGWVLADDPRDALPPRPW